MPFSEDPMAVPAPVPPVPASPDSDAGAAGVAPVSAAAARFQTCRWRRPPDSGLPACCAHRDVLPLTGTRGFDPDAWCTDCRFYKLRRVPKKHVEPDEPYLAPVMPRAAFPPAIR